MASYQNNLFLSQEEIHEDFAFKESPLKNNTHSIHLKIKSPHTALKTVIFKPQQYSKLNHQFKIHVKEHAFKYQLSSFCFV